MLNAAAWAGFAASFLILGAWLGTVLKVSERTIGLVMGFGAGALIASVSFELTEEAFNRGGGVPLAIGLALGALTFFVGDVLIDRIGGPDEDDTALSLVLGAALDGVPESIIIGLSLVLGGAVEAAFLVSVAISNVPEGFASAAKQHAAGEQTRTILVRWVVIIAASALFGALGFTVGDDLQAGTVAFIQAFAAGALLTMVMDTMAPEAFREAGLLTGLMTVAGFAFAYFLSVR